jgi:hypothetical protein
VSAILTGVRACANRWRLILATVSATVAILRVGLWIARAVGAAASVDTAANLLGLGAYVAPFEAMFDDILTRVLKALGIVPTG